MGRNSVRQTVSWQQNKISKFGLVGMPFQTVFYFHEKIQVSRFKCRAAKSEENMEILKLTISLCNRCMLFNGFELIYVIYLAILNTTYMYMDRAHIYVYGWSPH